MPSIIGLIVAAATITSSFAVPLDGEMEQLEKRGLLPAMPSIPGLNLGGLLGNKAVTTTSSNAAATTPAPANSIAGKPNTFSGTLVTGSALAGTTLAAGQIIPTGLYNPNGLIFNPFDYSSLPFTWPGKPTAPGQAPPPRPSTPPFPLGGPKASSYVGPAWLPVGVSQLIPALAQLLTNGNSYWGLLTAPTLPPWLGGGSPPTTCGSIPTTGITRFYDFTVSYQKIAPDGVVKNGLVVNGQFPGPLIEANWGDW
jgi:hypothetical protein